MPNLSYDPRVFLCPNMEAARNIILTPEAGLTTDDRWITETDWLADRLEFPIGGLVIDYGCGIGRLAKRLESNAVLGVDISPTMRGMSEEYVKRSSFGAVQPAMLQHMVTAGLCADGALAVWCLQHAAAPELDIGLLYDALMIGAKFYVVNRPERYVPATDGTTTAWASDGKDVFSILSQIGFQLQHTELMPEHLCAPGAEFRRYVKV